MSRENQSRITVSVDGIGVLPGSFADRTGGKGTSNNTEVWPGGMDPKVNLGGTQDLDDVTLVRPMFLDRDQALIGPLMAARGVKRATVSEQRLDADKNAFGAPEVWVGILTEVDSGDAQASSSDGRMLTLTVAPDGFTA
jgi:hypothetical protein